MKKIAYVLSVLLLMLASDVYAQDAGCEAKAAEKKLAGAAKNSFVKKCEKDTKLAAAQTECDGKAAEKSLKGAAKNSFTKKCIKDATQ